MTSITGPVQWFSSPVARNIAITLIEPVAGVNAGGALPLDWSFPPYLPWRNILIKPKEISWIIVRFDRDEACPPFAVGLGDTVIFVSTHEVDVHSWSH